MQVEQAADGDKLIVERRITQRIYDYWDQLRGDHPMPREEDIDPDVLGEDWQHCFLLQTRDIDHIEQFNFTYLGEGILNAYKHAGIETDNLYLIGPNAFYLAPLFMDVVHTREPRIEENHFTSSNGSQVHYRQCLLPLGNKSKQVEAIFGAVLFKTEVSTSAQLKQAAEPGFAAEPDAPRDSSLHRAG